MRAEDPYFNKLIRIMATRCMSAAQYFSSGAVWQAALRALHVLGALSVLGAPGWLEERKGSPSTAATAYCLLSRCSTPHR